MAHKGRYYEIFDVFSDTVLSGNPVAIVHESSNLTSQQMQAIAREFNLSETVFVFPPKDQKHTAYLRIFKADGETSFAGHPAIGAAVSLALKNNNRNDALVILEEKVGIIRAVVDLRETIAFAEFDIPKLPVQLPMDTPREIFAAAFGLESKEVGFENHVPSLWTAGVPFFFVPLHNLKTIASALPDPVYISENFDKLNVKTPSFYLYSRETQLFQSAFHVRMFRPDGWEDAATGSAASAFCGVVQHFDHPLDGKKNIWLEQGLEMNRASKLRLEWYVEDHKLVSARIGGKAVKFAEGHMFL
ncbi:PhzF family phenazine biosynthesis protein [uncultured Bartonella sp.]|uniref:PhzF family phenazine biosynthesis protein n=1 Tax=uncultured Bartonella sp. TaxID=104108 RepID=UPI002604341B|nr:PhzF family phenazine biosynthesis protein [uncultured Bartonella sp.]